MDRPRTPNSTALTLRCPRMRTQGVFSTNPEFNGADATSEPPISPKMPSRGEPIGAGSRAGHVSAGHLSADTHEPPPAGVAAQPEYTCSIRSTDHKFWDLGSGLECEMCGEPLAKADGPAPPTRRTQAPPPDTQPQRARWSSRQGQEGVPAYD